MEAEPLVVFSLTSTPRGLPDSVRMILIPGSDRFVDLGYRTHTKVGFRKRGLAFDFSDAYLAIHGESNTWAFLRTLLVNLPTEYKLVSELKRPFASMLTNIFGYQHLLRLLGKEPSREACRVIHDIVFLRSYGEQVPGWEAFERTSVFERSFMRRSESAFAYENAGAIFHGATFEAEDARADFNAVVKLGFSEMSFSFRFPQAGLAPGRLAVLIGRNGTGKTESLRRLTRALIGKGARGAEIAPRIRFNQILVFAHAASMYRFRTISRRSSVSLHEFSFDRSVSTAARTELTGLLVRVLQGAIGTYDPLQLLGEVFEREFPGIEILLPIRSGNELSLPFRENVRGLAAMSQEDRFDYIDRIDRSGELKFVDCRSQKKVRQLSLGQEIFIRFLLHVLAKCGPASILVIDEPENFLHPNLISQFVGVLSTALDATKSIAFVATHSPFIAREVSRSQLHVLRMNAENGKTSVSSPRLQTFGANVSAISDDIFGDDMAGHLHKRVLQRLANGDATFDELYETYKDDLSLDAWMLLRAMQKDGVA
jgi:hypothetical protein